MGATRKAGGRRAASRRGQARTGAARRSARGSTGRARSASSRGRARTAPGRGKASSGSSRRASTARRASAGRRASAVRRTNTAPRANRAASPKRTASARGARADALAMLIQDHRKVAQLFEQFETAKQAQQKRQIFGTIKNELDTHAKLEEEFFYPAAEKSGEKQLREEVEEAHGEHDKMKQMLNEAEGLDPESGEFDATVAGLKGAVEHHVEEEENEMFPKARQRFSQQDLVEMARRMKERKTALLAGNGAKGRSRSLVSRVMGR